MNQKTNDFIKEVYNSTSNEPAGCNHFERVETISPSLNWALNGGIVPGRFYVLTGPEGSGKSMLAVSIVHKLMKAKPNSLVFWFDAEGSWTDHWVRIFFKGDDYKIIEQKRLVVRKAQTSDEIFDYFLNEVMDMVDRGLEVSACVVDSVQQIIGPKEAGTANVGDSTMGDLATLMGKAMRKILEPARAKKIPWFFIAQVRDNFEVAGQKYVSREDKYALTGGRAFKHGIDVTLLLEAAKGKKNSIYDPNIKNITDDNVKIGHLIRGVVLKNRLGPIGHRFSFLFEYAKGIVGLDSEWADLALSLGIVKLDGRTYLLDGEKIAVGAAGYVKEISENQQLKDKILEEVKKTYKEQECKEVK